MDIEKKERAKINLPLPATTAQKSLPSGPIESTDPKKIKEDVIYELGSRFTRLWAHSQKGPRSRFFSSAESCLKDVKTLKESLLFVMICVFAVSLATAYLIWATSFDLNRFGNFEYAVCLAGVISVGAAMLVLVTKVPSEYRGWTTIVVAQGWKYQREKMIDLGLVDRCIDSIMVGDRYRCSYYKPNGLQFPFDEKLPEILRSMITDEAVSVLEAERDGVVGKRLKSKRQMKRLIELAKQVQIKVDENLKSYFDRAKSRV